MELGFFRSVMRTGLTRSSLLLFALAAACGRPEEPERLLALQETDAIPQTQSVASRPTSIEPTPDPNAERIAALDREIAALEGATADEDPYVIRDLEDRIARDQEMIAALSLEADLERATQSDRLRVAQFQQQQEIARQRERLAALADIVRAEELAFANQRAQFASIVVPDQTDLYRQGQAALAVSEERLTAARANYESVLAEYNSAPESAFADQSRIVEENRSRLGEFATMIADARADLDQAVAARNQIAAERAAREERLRTLREDRGRLTAANAAE